MAFPYSFTTLYFFSSLHYITKLAFGSSIGLLGSLSLRNKITFSGIPRSKFYKLLYYYDYALSYNQYTSQISHATQSNASDTTSSSILAVRSILLRTAEAWS